MSAAFKWVVSKNSPSFHYLCFERLHTTQYPLLELGKLISKAWATPASEARTATVVAVNCIVGMSCKGIEDNDDGDDGGCDKDGG